MTGWRIGWMLVPERLRGPSTSSPATSRSARRSLAQHACVAAFTEASYAELDGHVERYAENRRLLLDGLAAARHRPARPRRRRVLRLRRRRPPHRRLDGVLPPPARRDRRRASPGHRLRHRGTATGSCGSASPARTDVDPAQALDRLGDWLAPQAPTLNIERACAGLRPTTVGKGASTGVRRRTTEKGVIHVRRHRRIAQARRPAA